MMSMEERSQIRGERIVQILEALKADKTHINLRLRGVDGYERLTMINDIRQNSEGIDLILDPPRGFQSAVSREPRWRLQLTFTGQDGLEYHFNTQGGRIENDGIYVPAPETLHRVQRRKAYRVETPLGTLMALTMNGEPLALDLINISQTGGLGIVRRLKRKGLSFDPIFKMGEHLFNLVIDCPGGDDTPPSKATIKKAVVRRIEMDNEQYRHRYALEFLEVPPADQRTLVAFIYRVQRELLRKR